MFAPSAQSSTQTQAAKHIQDLPGLIAFAEDGKRRYEALLELTNASRSKGIEPPGNVVRAQQGLYDSWRALSRSTTAARTALIPHIKQASLNGALNDNDLETLAAAKILPRVNGKGVIPPGFLQGLNGAIGLGILPLIPIAICLIIAGSLVGGLTVFLAHKRQAEIDRSNMSQANQSADVALEQWKQNEIEKRRYATERRKTEPDFPMPELAPLPGLQFVDSGSNSAASGEFISGPVKTVAIAAAVLAGLYVAFGRKRRS